MPKRTIAKTKAGVYILGDALVEIPKAVKPHSADLVFTSPPGIHQTPYFERRDTEGFARWLADEVLPMLVEITKPDGWIILSQVNSRHDGKVLTNNVTYINGMYGLGWPLREERVIVRDGVDAVNLYVNTWQHFLAFSQKGKVAQAAKVGRFVRDIWVYKHDQIGDQKIWPQAFVQTVVQAFSKPGGLVVDPFAGVGPVLYGAARTGRRYVGTEISREFWNPKLRFTEGLI